MDVLSLSWFYWILTGYEETGEADDEVDVGAVEDATDQSGKA